MQDNKVDIRYYNSVNIMNNQVITAKLVDLISRVRGKKEKAKC